MKKRFNLKLISRIFSMLILIEGFALLPCNLIALIDHDNLLLSRLIFLSIVYIILGIIGLRSTKKINTNLKPHEGYFIACTSWIFCSFLGMIPYLIAGMNYPLIGSLFEAIAGFTTTGCSLLDINSMPRPLVLWRSITNWLGGMGILVFMVSIFSALGISGQSIASAETTGPNLQKTGARFSDTGKFLYLAYFILTVLEFVLLLFSGLSAFTCLTNTFSSISTGGLLIPEAELSAFNSSYVRIVITVFTILSSINYTLYFFMFKGRFKEVIHNNELRIFLIIIVVATALVTLSLMIHGTYDSFSYALRDSFFQVVSFISTSGFFISDYSTWPAFSHVVLFLLLFVGGCSMSTSGSLKVIRIITLFKLANRGVFKLIHPRSVKAVVIRDEVLPAKRVSEITSHIILFFIVFFIGALLLSFDNFSMEETLTTSIGLFTNTGLSLSETGIHGDFSSFSPFSQFVMSLLMLLGRLEIYSFLFMFSKSYWRDNNTNRI